MRLGQAYDPRARYLTGVVLGQIPERAQMESPADVSVWASPTPPAPLPDVTSDWAKYTTIVMPGAPKRKLPKAMKPPTMRATDFFKPIVFTPAQGPPPPPETVVEAAADAAQTDWMAWVKQNWIWVLLGMGGVLLLSSAAGGSTSSRKR